MIPISNFSDTSTANTPQVPFVIITTEETLEMGLEAVRQGAADYLIEPLQFDRLVASVGKTLEKRGLEFESHNYHEYLQEQAQQRRVQLQNINGSHGEHL